MKLDVKAFALTGGILWGVTIFILTWLKMAGYGDGMDIVKAYYIGYSVTPPGSLVGLVYGFLDAGIGCLIFSLLYNRMAKG
jgi:hypothetical protein